MSDTSEIVNDCLVHYEARHIQVRLDFYLLCAFDPKQFNTRHYASGKVIKDEPNQECMAKILRIVETLTNARKSQWHVATENARKKGVVSPPEPQEWPIALSYSAFVSLIYGTYKESTVRNSIAFLVHGLKYLKCYQEKKNTIPQYVLRIDYVQACLKAHYEKTPSPVEFNTSSHLLNSTGEMLKVTPQGVESNTNNIECEIDIKKKESINATLSNDKDSSQNVSSFSSNHSQENEGNVPPTEKRTPKERLAASVAPRAVQDIPHRSPEPATPAMPEKPKRGALTLEQHATADMWDSLHEVGCNRTDYKIRKAIEQLTVQHATASTLRHVRRKLSENPYWKEITIELVAKNYQPLMQSYKLSQQAQASSGTSASPDVKNATTSLLTPEEMALSWEEARRTLPDATKWAAYTQTHERPVGK